MYSFLLTSRLLLLKALKVKIIRVHVLVVTQELTPEVSSPSRVFLHSRRTSMPFYLDTSLDSHLPKEVQLLEWELGFLTSLSGLE